MVLWLSCETRRAIPSVKKTFILALKGSQSQRGFYLYCPLTEQALYRRYMEETFNHYAITSLRIGLPLFTIFASLV